MSRDMDDYIREAVKERRRMSVEAQVLWMNTRHAAGHRDYLDKIAMRQVKIVVDRCAEASWTDIVAAIARVAARPANRKGYVYALEDEIATVAQERRARERSAAEMVDREETNAELDLRTAADISLLRARHPGLSIREIMQAEGLFLPFRSE